MYKTTYQIRLNRWKELKDKILSTWNRFEPEDVDLVFDNMRNLVEALKWKYGYSTSLAREEARHFFAQLPRDWFKETMGASGSRPDPFQWLWPNRVRI